MQAQLEEELRNLRVQDVLLQSVVSIINLTARRIAKEDERDLEQARIGIDAVRRLVDLLEGEPAKQVKNALSEMQMLYARESGGAASGAQGAADAGPGQADTAGAPASRPPESPSGPEPERKRPPGLWTPPGA
jgi:hypothetical protein